MWNIWNFSPFLVSNRVQKFLSSWSWFEAASMSHITVPCKLCRKNVYDHHRTKCNNFMDNLVNIVKICRILQFRIEIYEPQEFSNVSYKGIHKENLWQTYKNNHGKWHPWITSSQANGFSVYCALLLLVIGVDWEPVAWVDVNLNHFTVRHFEYVHRFLLAYENILRERQEPRCGEYFLLKLIMENKSCSLFIRK